MINGLKDKIGLTGRSIETGRYRVTGIVGRGGFAVVYEGFDRELGARVAIKVLSEKFFNNPTLIERFKQEAKNLASFRQKSHIITILSYGTEKLASGKKIHYYVMPYLRQSLRSFLNQQQNVSVNFWYRVADQVARALETMHERYFIHRDVKPENILLDEDGNCFLSDFGLVRQEDFAHLKISAGRAGTPQYMAPEQLAGKKPDPRADIYALGVVLFELATGHRPAPGRLDRQMRHLALPQQKIISRCMQRNRSKRFSSARELRQVLHSSYWTHLEAASFLTLLSPGEGEASGFLSQAGGSLRASRHREKKPLHRPSKRIKASLFWGTLMVALLDFFSALLPTRAMHGGYVQLISFPPGAGISVSGNVIKGVTPVLLGPFEGEITLAVYKSGYLPWARKIRVIRGDTLLVVARLPGRMGEAVHLQSARQRPNAVGFSKGAPDGLRTSATVTHLHPGRPEIGHHKPGFLRRVTPPKKSTQHVANRSVAPARKPRFSQFHRLVVRARQKIAAFLNP